MRNLYALMDLKSSFFNDPIVVPHEAIIIRQLKTMVNDEKSSLSKYPEDFALFKLAEFDEKSGAFEIEKPPKHVINLATLKEVQQNG